MPSLPKPETAPTSPRPITALLAILLTATAVAAPLHAQSRASAYADPVRIDLVDRDSGQWLPQYFHRGEHWVAGAPGQRYGVRLVNTTAERVLVVLSVDGINAITGDTAHPAQSGYVLAPWQSTEISGWRKSMQDVAQFVFTDLPDSYAARTGRPDNVGTIGIAVFRERRPMVVAPPPPIAAPGQQRYEKSRASSQAADAAAAPQAVYGHEQERMATQRIGTGHGQREWAPVGQTTFERASARPAQLLQLRYDAPDALAARGIMPRLHPRRLSPQAFPDGFVADPPRGRHGGYHR